MKSFLPEILCKALVVIGAFAIMAGAETIDPKPIPGPAPGATMYRFLVGPFHCLYIVQQNPAATQLWCYQDPTPSFTLPLPPGWEKHIPKPGLMPWRIPLPKETPS